MSVESRTSGTVAVADRNSGSNGADREVVVILPGLVKGTEFASRNLAPNIEKNRVAHQ